MLLSIFTPRLSLAPALSQLTPEPWEMPLSDWWIFWHLRWDKSHSDSPLAALLGPGPGSKASCFSHLPRVTRTRTMFAWMWEVDAFQCSSLLLRSICFVVVFGCHQILQSWDDQLWEARTTSTRQRWPGWLTCSVVTIIRCQGSPENIFPDSCEAITNQPNYVGLIMIASASQINLGSNWLCWLCKPVFVWMTI